MTEEDRGPDRSIGARLYSASRYHARKARALADTSSPHERLDAVTHAGAAVELIAKAVLADLDVRLLPDREALHQKPIGAPKSSWTGWPPLDAC
jgi:hypothetical protein